MNEKLKPCPCCGGEGAVWDKSRYDVCVRCDACELQTKWHPTISDAIAAWNRRVGSDINVGSNSTNEELLKEFIELRERFQPLYRETGLVGLESHTGIHLSLEMFLDTFKTYKSKPRDTEVYPEELYAYYNGTKFFCIR